MSGPSAPASRLRGLRVGIDFDNTIVCYDDLFGSLAAERGLLHSDAPLRKTAVRDRLREAGRENEWTELQGEAYGPRMAEAHAFAGAKETMRALLAGGAEVFIVSHKTRRPYRGADHDLHAAARAWLEREGFFEAGGVGLAREAVLFEPDADAKAAAIVRLGCTHFIDDLPEFLAHARLPADLVRILFAPLAVGPREWALRSWSWSEIAAYFAGRAS